jgi:PAS domain S-box-containing protein
MDDLGARVSRRLDPSASSAAEARRLVREAVTSVDRDDLVEVGELLISEVVTNAVVHAGTPVEIEVTVGPDGLRAEVSDGSRHLPAVRTQATLAGTGRGLHMLEQLVDSWGVQVRGAGKTVWFVVSSGDGPADPLDLFDDDLTAVMDLDMEERRTVDRGYRVVLLGVPLLLHAAWQVHSDSILREYLLVRLDEDSTLDAIEEHAAAHDAMALLREQIPAPSLGKDPAELMSAAVEPGVSAERVVLNVPRGSAPHFGLLDDALDAALELADAGKLLTPPTQPELRLLRHWLCAEVQRQADGAEPTPWRLAADNLPAPGRDPVTWDASWVRTSHRALVCADDTNSIIAASGPAMELLGHPAGSRLEGRRLIEIIPQRYHQAHLAGFTLHLFGGRSALIGGSVAVPVRRHDGTEVMAELRLEALTLPDGRRAFVGELRPVAGAR